MRLVTGPALTADRFGASLYCAVGECPAVFHMPCAAASAAFQNINNHQVWCFTHLDRVPPGKTPSSPSVTRVTAAAAGVTRYLL